LEVPIVVIAIYPLNLGTLIRDKSSFTYLKNFGVRGEFPITAWLIEINGKLILVDTGSKAPEETATHYHPFVRTEHQELPTVLHLLGVNPLDIEIVILTHLHWDHCYNTTLFPNARMFVQRDELLYAAAPLPVPNKGYDPSSIPQKELVLVDGDQRIAESVWLLKTPGHTPGSQVVLLDGPRRRALIAGDTVPLYENWHNPGFRLPNGGHTDLSEYFRSLNKISELTLDLILPGHDMRVFETNRYEL
jgi:glyoxylase-like metal-dependent hydrolase (beta-lactamase superfamily II)